MDKFVFDITFKPGCIITEFPNGKTYTAIKLNDKYGLLYTACSEMLPIIIDELSRQQIVDNFGSNFGVMTSHIGRYDIKAPLLRPGSRIISKYTPRCEIYRLIYDNNGWPGFLSESANVFKAMNARSHIDAIYQTFHRIDDLIYVE